MLYTIICTRTDGTQTTAHTQADSPKQAHEKARDGSLFTLQKGDNIRVYPTTIDENNNIIVNGVIVGALQVMRSTATNMIGREGGKLQHQLYGECHRHNIVQNYTIDIDRTYSHNMQDCLSTARLAIWEGVKNSENVAEQHKKSYSALNAHLYASKQIQLDKTAMRESYIEDINGDIINVNGEINRILKPSERYIPQADEDTVNAESVLHRAVIDNVVNSLTAIQAETIRLLANGNSIHEIARKTKRNRKTIQERMIGVYRKAESLYPDSKLKELFPYWNFELHNSKEIELVSEAEAAFTALSNDENMWRLAHLAHLENELRDFNSGKKKLDIESYEKIFSEFCELEDEMNECADKMKEYAAILEAYEKDKRIEESYKKAIARNMPKKTTVYNTDEKNLVIAKISVNG